MNKKQHFFGLVGTLEAVFYLEIIKVFLCDLKKMCVQNMSSACWPSHMQTSLLTHTHTRWNIFVQKHNENFNLRKEQRASAWGEWTLARCISCRHITAGLSVSSNPFRDLSNSLHSSKVPAGSPGSLPSTLWRGSEPRKAQTMHNGPSSTTHDPVMKRREYGWRGWAEREEKKRAGGAKDVQAFSLREEGRCMLIER